MRHPKRIKVILKEIERIWNEYPDLRLMQLLLNAIGAHVKVSQDEIFETELYTIDHYNTEDKIVLERLKETYKYKKASVKRLK